MKKFSFILLILLIASLFSSCQDLDNFLGSEGTEDLGDDADENIQGFWFLTGTNGDISEDAKQRGIALNVEGTTIDTYSGFEIEKQNAYLNLSENGVIQYSIDGNDYEANVLFDKRDGYTLMILENDEGNLIFEKTEFEVFYLYKEMTEAVLTIEKGSKTIDLGDNLSDEELRFYISDTYWFELYFMCSDGSTSEMLENTFILYSDGTGIDEFSDSIEYVTWEIESGYLYIYYNDESVFYSPVDYAYDAATGYVYLYLYDLNEGYEGCAWIYYNYIE